MRWQQKIESCVEECVRGGRRHSNMRKEQQFFREIKKGNSSFFRANVLELQKESQLKMQKRPAECEFEKTIHHQRAQNKRARDRVTHTGQNSNYIFTPRTENVIKSSGRKKGNPLFSLSRFKVYIVVQNE